MNSVVSIVSIIMALLFYIAILLVGFDFRKIRILVFSRISTNWISENLLFFVGPLPLFIPVLFFLKNYSINSNGNILILGYIGVSLLIAFSVLFRYYGDEVQSIKNRSDTLESNSTYNVYLFLTNFGLKLPIIVFVYALILESMYGNNAFRIIIAIITMSGLLLIIHGSLAYIHSGIIIGIALLISLIVLLLLDAPMDQLIRLKGILITSNGTVFDVNSLWYIPLILVLAGVWIVDLKHTADYISQLKTTKFSSNLINSIILLFSFLLLMPVFLNNGNDSFFRGLGDSPNILNGLQFNGFQLIIVSGLFIIGLMSVFQSTSHVIAYQIFKKYRKNAGNEIIILISRLTIVLSVVFAILLTPLLTLITFRVLHLLLTIFFSLSIPVLVIYSYSIVEPNISSKTISYSLISGLFPVLLFTGLTLANVMNQVHLLQFYSFHLLYSFLCVFLVSVIIKKTNNTEIGKTQQYKTVLKKLTIKE